MKPGNRVLARLARRSIVKAPVRSLLIVALIAIVVAVGTGAAIAIRSATPTNEDRALADFGAADTVITVGPEILDYVPLDVGEPVFIDGTYVDPASPGYDAVVADLIAKRQRGFAWAQEFDPAATTEALEAALDTDVLVSRRANVVSGAGPYRNQPAFYDVADVDMGHPLAEGLWELIDGRFPISGNEVALAGAGNYRGDLAVGDTVTVDRMTLDVVGLVTKPSTRNGGSALVTPAVFDMLTINDNTLAVEVRAVFGDDVASRIDAVEQTLNWQDPELNLRDVESVIGRTDPAIRIVPALLSGVLGIQMALVTAAAFAVGVRRRTKEFGQLITTGMDGNQLRRMILFEALWLGLIGAAVGVAIGVLAVTQAIGWGWLDDVGSRYVSTPRWNVIDWLAPVAIGVLSAVAAAWWPARSLTKAPVTSALAGHLPAGRPKATTPRWGLLVVIVGSLSVAGLAASSSADQGSMTFNVVFLAAVVATFLGALLFIGSILAAINQRSGRFPLLARLIVRSSDRHRSRSWMVIGAFIATLALPVLVGASFKAYPDTFSTSSSEYEGRLLTVGGGATDRGLPPEAAAGVDLRADVNGFITDFNEMVQADFDLVGSIVGEESPLVNLTVGRDNWRQGFGSGITVISPELVELLDIPADLARQVQGDTALYIGTDLLIDGSIELSQYQPGGTEWFTVPIEMIDGPDISNYQSNTLVSPELAAKFDDESFGTSTLHLFAEPLSDSDEEALFERANELWVERFGSYALRSGATEYSPEIDMQDWALSQTQIALQRPFQIRPTQDQLQWAALALTVVLASLIALVTASLAAVELDGELQSMIATGAAPRTRRLMLGGQTVYHLVVAAVLGIPLALLLFNAVVRADVNAPSGITIPWGATALSAVVIPLVVGALVASVFRNGRSAVSRRLS